MNRLSSVLRYLLLIALCIAPAAYAEHEADHRYVILGTVLDADERPLADQTVEVFADGTRLATTTTDGRGRYRVQLHLHDADLGRRLTIQQGERRTEIRVVFTPGDQITARNHRVDFVGESMRDVARSRGAAVIPPALYYAAGVVAIVVVLSIAARRSRRKAQQARHAEQQPKTRKRRRKHR